MFAKVISQSAATMTKHSRKHQFEKAE